MSSTAHLVLRRLTVQDHPKVLRLWARHGGDLPATANSRHGLAAILARHANLSVVVEDAGEIVATALCTDDGRAGYVNHLVVAPAYRAHNLENSVLAVCIMKLKDLGITECHLFTRTGERSLRWFQESAEAAEANPAEELFRLRDAPALCA